MSAGRPDHLPPEWLAAYADGELGPRDRARVEEWLRDNPDARDALDAQEALGPANGEFWSAVRAPQPSGRQWANTIKGIKAAASTRPTRSWAGWLGTVGLMATAATLLVALPAADGPIVHGPPLPCPNHFGPFAPSPDDTPFVIADAADVRIISLPEEAADLLVVGTHPMGDSALILAGRGEVAFLGLGPELAAQLREPVEANADDLPMLWAPAPKDPEP
jgi:hypothetical protein